MSSAPRVRLFGVPAVLNGGGAPLKLRTVKQLGALVYLALEGREQAVSRDRLVDLLWDDVTPERGRHSVAQACSAIRGALGRGALERVGSGLRLAAPVVTDLDVVAGEFDRLPLADPLAEAEWWAGPDFAHWVEGARGRLRRAGEEALRRAMGDFRRSGQTSAVHAAAAVLYQLDPLSDTAVHALAERELIAGDVVGAIRLLRTHLARVREALGCTPHRDVERLLRRLEAGSHPPIERVPARLAVEASALRPSVFVGREKELAHLEAEWQRVAEGTFRSCLVLGPGGIGKSSLVRRFAATVAARARPVFVVTCQEIGEGIPFAALSDLITALTRDPSVSAADPKWLAEIARIHPALRSQYPGIPEAPDAPPESIRLRVAEGLLQMLDAVADSAPVAIVFDDLPFMDPATRDVLHVLARRVGDHPVLLISTARTPELLESSKPVFPGLSIVTWNTQVRLPALNGESTRQLASALSPELVGERRVLERIESIADGNPHFTEMLVADWERHASASLAGGQSGDTLPENWQPPDSLRQAFAQTYAGLGYVAQEILHVLAVAGRALGAEELSESLIPRQQHLDEATVDLLRRGILRLDDGWLSFKNELHRAFVYYAITGDVRRFFHSRLGKALLTRDAGSYMSKLEAGRHLEQAGLHSEAAGAVLQGARLAIENGAPAEAESALRMVLGSNHDPKTLSQLEIVLAESLSAQGHYAEALDVLERIGHGELSDRKTDALVAHLTAQALQRTRLTDDRTIVRAAAHAIELAESSGSESLQAAAAQVVAEAASEIELPEMLTRAVEITRRLAHDSNSDATRAQALLTTGFCLFMAGQFDVALVALTESVALLRATGLESDLTRALNGRGICLMGLGRHLEAVEPFATALSIAGKLNDTAHRGILITNLGVAYEEVGMFGDAEECYQSAIAYSPLDQSSRGALTMYMNAAHIALIRNDLNAAMEALVVAREAAAKSQSWRLASEVDLSHADLFLALGEPELAWPVVARASALTWGRERSIDTNGREVRLALHYALATAGPARMAELVHELGTHQRPLRVAHTLEIAGFLAWAARQGHLDDELLRSSGFQADPKRLMGPVAALSAVGVPPCEECTRRPGESALQMIKRVFPSTPVLPRAREVLARNGIKPRRLSND